MLRSIFLVFVLSVLFVNSVSATDYCTSSNGVTMVAGSTVSGASAHLIFANPSNCSNLCSLNGGRAAYIEFADKELYAIALSNSNMSTRPSLTLVWETSSSKGINGSNVTCRIISINN